ncbi:MAG: hypothetical protein JWM90_1250 [Thermoleophilia bacterium]|nr:hypothetical protein [Thermoleophilia bacterium]
MTVGRISCCCAPVAAAPVTTATSAPTTGGGVTTTPAPAPIATTAPVAPATAPPAPQPITTPAPTTTGGGSTGYDAIDAPSPDTNLIPAPITGGGGATAMQLPTWPQWKQELGALGLNAADLAKVGAQPLDDEQLAALYQQVYNQLEAGAVTEATTVPNATGTLAVGGWSPQWAAKFTALGLDAAALTKLEQEATKLGASDSDLQSLYETLAAQGNAGDASKAPGWNAEWKAKFEALGMPPEYVTFYSESGAPTAGIEAAYKHVNTRLADFTERGWMAKATELKLDPMTTWGMILADTPLTDDQVREQLNGPLGLLGPAPMRNGLGGLAGQIAWSLVPGVRAAEYIAGRETFSTNEIKQDDGMQIAGAALSAAALGVLAIAGRRGVSSVVKGWSAHAGGFSALKAVGTKGVTAGQGVSDAALGAVGTLGGKQKLMSLLPWTNTHRSVVGLGHAEAAAAAFVRDGSKLAGHSDSALQTATLNRWFDDVKTGTTRVLGDKNAYLPTLKRPTIVGYDPTLSKAGTDSFVFNRSLHVNDGRSQLVGVLKASGDKLTTQPGWIDDVAPKVWPNVTRLSAEQDGAVGAHMASNALGRIGMGNDGFRATSKHAFTSLRKVEGLAETDWYKQLATDAASGVDDAARGARTAAASTVPTATQPAATRTTNEAWANLQRLYPRTPAPAAPTSTLPIYDRIPPVMNARPGEQVIDANGIHLLG